MKFILLILSLGLIFYSAPLVKAQDNDAVVFRQAQPNAYCTNTNQPEIELKWDELFNSPYMVYTVYYLDSVVGTMQGGWDAGASTHSFVIDQSRGLIPGHQYGFVIKAHDTKYNITYFSDQDLPGGWSHGRYGWTTFPQCGLSSRKGDANGDGVVNIFDFNQLVSHFNQSSDTIATLDFDNNGKINIFDFNGFVSQGFH